MDTLQALAALRAMRVFGDIAAGALTRAHLDECGIRDAGLWERMSQIYFGPTRYKKLQAAAREAAAPLSPDAVAVIEKHLRKLSPKAAVTPMEVRVELCELRGTVAEIDQEAAARVAAYNRQAPGEDDGWRLRSMKGGKNTDPFGTRTFSLTLLEREAAHVNAHLDPIIKQLRDSDATLGYEEAKGIAAYRQLVGAVGEGVPSPPLPRPFVLIPKNKYVEILRQEGDETIFGLSDGTTMTGAELAAQGMAEDAYFGIFSPLEGGINAYRQERFANEKQRLLLAAETLVCPTPECTTPADLSQVHHIKPWSKGGETNLPNMTIACKVHNGRNDDDPNAPPKFGRLERQPGGVVFIPPDGGPPRVNRHPIRKLSAMGLLADA
ncbi:MAG: HNH endonuclease signature motif containing protein [Corynebacterium sp.]|uniref:HNH endonuclease signature motif containing protein n=1 Tax=Corynebacterium sp. TaxID=1720 RepID=UPI0026DF6653|nr:HNH endonuclease signature motif containing protein [Corynebacterium sp.]MDO5670482.1 HNH endonuclease signature motif containing protein [Corynebacterium sp.]